MKDQKIQSPAPAKKIRREKRVAYNNARIYLFKNLRAIFLNGHDDFEVIIGEKFDDVPVRQADNGQGYVIAFKTDRYGFSEEEAQIYDRAVTTILNETHAFLSENPDYQRIMGIDPRKAEIEVLDDEALYVLVMALCNQAPRILDMDDKKYFDFDPEQESQKAPVASFTENQLISLSGPIPKDHFNRRNMNYRRSFGYVMPFAMADIYSFMRLSNSTTREPLRFSLH